MTKTGAHQNFSIIVPVYNGEETLKNCLQALLHQDYPKNRYEIVLVNDGSTDDTKIIAETEQKAALRLGLGFNLISLPRNRGRIICRETGARSAKYASLVFVDCRVFAQDDLLKNANTIGYQPIMGTHYELDKYSTPFATILYLLARKWYHPYFPQYEYSKELWIDENNFDRAPKGFGDIIISRKLFLESIPKLKNRYVSDDTAILKNILRKKRILRHTEIKVKYIYRTNFREALVHLYERGPRFANYYLFPPRTRIYPLLLIATTLFLATIVLPVINLKLGALWLLTLLAGWGALLIWLSENPKDAAILATFTPIAAAVFAAGVGKGLILKLTKRY